MGDERNFQERESLTAAPRCAWDCPACNGDCYVRDENGKIEGLCPVCDGTGWPPPYEPTAQEFNDAMEGM